MPTVRSRGDLPLEAAILSALGGFLDAYTYLARGHVFANAQTGNVVLFGIEGAQGHWAEAARHVPPVLAFLVGMVTVEALARSRRHAGLHRPARVVLLVEVVVFALAGLLPADTPDTIPAVLIAWAATLQVGTFRQVGDMPYNTTFTTGNLRSLVSALTGWLVDHDGRSRRHALDLLAVVLSFAAGAVIGGAATRATGHWAVLMVIPALFVVMASMTRVSRRLRSGRVTATEQAEGHP